MRLMLLFAVCSCSVILINCSSQPTKKDSPPVPQPTIPEEQKSSDAAKFVTCIGSMRKNVYHGADNKKIQSEVNGLDIKNLDVAKAKSLVALKDTTKSTSDITDKLSDDAKKLIIHYCGKIIQVKKQSGEKGNAKWISFRAYANGAEKDQETKEHIVSANPSGSIVTPIEWIWKGDGVGNEPFKAGCYIDGKNRAFATLKISGDEKERKTKAMQKHITAKTPKHTSTGKHVKENYSEVNGYLRAHGADLNTPSDTLYYEAHSGGFITVKCNILNHIHE